MLFFRTLLAFFIVISYPALAQHKVKETEQFERDGTLYSVLQLAYENNPTIRAARAEFLAVKEQLPQARSGLLPTINANGDITYTDTDAEGTFVFSDGANTSKSASLDINQPVYRGGSTQADVATARNIIAAQQFSLSAIEQNILYQATVVYMDLHRDLAILGLQENNKILVSRQLEQADARFIVGELTRTDVSQAKARLAEAKANIINAQAAVKTAIASFNQIVGTPPPNRMGYPLVRFEIPATLQEALEIAESNNRTVLQAQYNKQAAESRIDSVRGELLPQISAIGRVNKAYDPSTAIDEQRDASIGLSASIPLYTGGATRSRIREAKKKELQQREEINVAREAVKQQTVRDWSSWKASKAETKARQAQVEAAKVAREGVQYETEFGERTTLDALDSNQELLRAQVELIKSMRNEVVSRFALAQSLGILVPQNLGFSTIKF